jgi:anti-anti-sigma factor
MQVHQLGDKGVFVVDIDEGVNEMDAEAVLDEIDNALHNVRLLILNCGDLVRVNSAGVGNMLRLKSRVDRKGGSMRLAALQPNVEGLMKLVRGDLVFDVFPDVEAAARP